MSNATNDGESLIVLSPAQANPGLTKPTDFTIGGQTEERIAELEAVDVPNKEIPDRNEVPCPKR